MKKKQWKIPNILEWKFKWKKSDWNMGLTRALLLLSSISTNMVSVLLCICMCSHYVFVIVVIIVFVFVIVIASSPQYPLLNMVSSLICVLLMSLSLEFPLLSSKSIVISHQFKLFLLHQRELKQAFANDLSHHIH